MSAWGDSWGSSWADSWGAISSAAAAGTAIENTDSTVVGEGNRYNVCSLSNWKLLPDELMTTWDGIKVREESYDPKHMRLHIGSKPEEQT